MQVTLPVSGKKLELACPSYGLLEQIRKGEIADVDGHVMGLYPELDWEALPSRDALLLLRVTISYAMAEPVAAIKNLLAGGDGAQTSSGPTTAPTVAA